MPVAVDPIERTIFSPRRQRRRHADVTSVLARIRRWLLARMCVRSRWWKEPASTAAHLLTNGRVGRRGAWPIRPRVDLALTPPQYAIGPAGHGVACHTLLARRAWFLPHAEP